jgi:hypothetical protein
MQHVRGFAVYALGEADRLKSWRQRGHLNSRIRAMAAIARTAQTDSPAKNALLIASERGTGQT